MGINGYLIKFSAINGEHPIQIYELANGVATSIATYTVSANAAQLVGSQAVLIHYFASSGQFLVSLNGVLAATAGTRLTPFQARWAIRARS